MSEQDLNTGVQGEPTASPQSTPQITPQITQPIVPPTIETEAEEVEQEVLPRLEIADYHDEEVRNVLETLNVFLPNVDLNRAFSKAIELGDSQAIDVNYLRDVLGDQADPLIATIGQMADAYGDVTDHTYQEVFDSVGGEEQWRGIAAFFNENATPAEKELARRLTTSKNPKEIKEGAEFVKAFAQRLGGVPKVPSKVGGVPAYGGGRGLSHEEYIEQYQALSASPKWNSDPHGRDEMLRELDQQRQLGIKLGR